MTTTCTLELVEAVRRSIQTHGLCKPKERIVVGVSGGLDSMVLLQLLHHLSQETGWKLVVAHFNHRLRGASSRADERLVRQTAQTLALPCNVEAGEVKQFARANGVSVEMAARELRHAFFAHTARQHQARCVALGHQAEDQLELFFLRLLRGAGTSGLAGMKWLSPSPTDRRITLIRPLLDQPRSALLDYARAHRIRFREDATNRALDIVRNRVRHLLIPLLQKEFQPALRAVLLRQMDILSAEDDFLEEQLKARRRNRAGEGFGDWPVALQRRHLQHQLQQLGLSASFELVEELRIWPGKKIMVAPHLILERTPGGSLHQAAVPTAKFNRVTRAVRLQGSSGSTVFQRHVIQWAVVRKKGPLPPPKTGREWFDADKVGTRILLRLWQQGDRFQPIGMRQPVKLQDLFTNLKVPVEERRRRLVACTESGDIWWVEGLRISECHKVDPGTVRRLRWDYASLTR